MTGWRAIPILGARDVATPAAYLRDTLGFRVIDEHRPGAELVYAITTLELSTRTEATVPDPAIATSLAAG